MYNYNRVINAIARYMDDEIVNKLSGVQRWVVGTGTGLILSKGKEVFNDLRNNEVVKMLHIIDGDNIDVDTLYGELKKQAQKSSATLNMPMIGTITFNENDIDKIYDLIKQ